jgi:DNA-binding CsgD family transcriptional regulator
MSLSDPIQMSRFIEKIYDCVLDQDRWQSTLENFCERLDGCAALFADTPSTLIQHGCAPDYWATYVDRYSRNNPWFDVALMNCPDNEVGIFYEMADLPTFQQCHFYKDWLKPQGWGDCIVAMLDRSSNGLAMLSAVRLEDQAPFGEEEVAFLRAVLPHAQKAAKLGRLFSRQSAQIAGMASMVERIKSAAFLIDRESKIVFANSQGAAVLTDGAYLREQAGFLTANDEGARNAIRAALLIPGHEPSFKILKGSGGEMILSIISPSDRSEGLTIVLLFSADNAPQLPGPLLMETYGMTAAEIRVLVGLVKGQTVSEMAQEFLVVPRTIRAHLKKLFLKTNTTRQTDLVRKVLTLAPAMNLFREKKAAF